MTLANEFRGKYVVASFRPVRRRTGERLVKFSVSSYTDITGRYVVTPPVEMRRAEAVRRIRSLRQKGYC